MMSQNHATGTLQQSALKVQGKSKIRLRLAEIFFFIVFSALFFLLRRAVTVFSSWYRWLHFFARLFYLVAFCTVRFFSSLFFSEEHCFFLPAQSQFFLVTRYLASPQFFCSIFFGLVAFCTEIFFFIVFQRQGHCFFLPALTLWIITGSSFNRLL